MSCMCMSVCACVRESERVYVRVCVCVCSYRKEGKYRNVTFLSLALTGKQGCQETPSMRQCDVY